MKVSLRWLQEWADFKAPITEVVDVLTRQGLEVDSYESLAQGLDDVVVAEITALEPHPEADKLKLCQVNDGSNNYKVVCGAANAAAGQKIAFIAAGKQFNGEKFEAKSLRGVESEGMILSAQELGITEESSGILELNADLIAGTPISDALNLNDYTIDIDLTPNRGDCLSIIGVAKEIAIALKAALKSLDIESIPAKHQDSIPIDMQAPERCARYVGRIIKGVNNNQASPMWLQEKLRRCGIRSISPIVDIGNFVMLELGQPMHAFDLQRIQGGIKVRTAKAHEAITLLDGQEIKLDEDTLVIADHQHPLAIAGVMGGEDSGVDENTTEILLESAFFAPEAIAGCARRFGLHTDSSHRFERGVDPYLQVKAAERFTELALEICGGEAGEVLEHKIDEHIPKIPTVRFRQARIHRILGISIPPKEVEDILRRLGMKFTIDGEGWLVVPPSSRFDIRIEEDLIEEVIRLYGYDNLRADLDSHVKELGSAPESKLNLRKLRQRLIDRGYHEAITYSFISPQAQQVIAPEVEALNLKNPISSELSVMRSSLWPGLLQAVKYNQDRQQNRAALFEMGLCFKPTKDGLEQKMKLGAAVWGLRKPLHWDQNKESIDFYDVKGDVEALLAMMHSKEPIGFKPAANPCLHPGQSAEILLAGQSLGQIGCLHPKHCKQLQLQGPVFVFELDVASITDIETPKFCQVSKFPAINRDLAFVVDKELAAQDLLDLMRTESGNWLKHLEIFDIYEGEAIDSAKKSVAIGLTLQHPSRTLVDEEVNDLIERIIAGISKQFNATLRE